MFHIFERYGLTPDYLFSNSSFDPLNPATFPKWLQEGNTIVSLDPILFMMNEFRSFWWRFFDIFIVIVRFVVGWIIGFFFVFPQQVSQFCIVFFSCTLVSRMAIKHHGKMWFHILYVIFYVAYTVHGFALFWKYVYYMKNILNLPRDGKAEVQITFSRIAYLIVYFKSWIILRYSRPRILIEFGRKPELEPRFRVDYAIIDDFLGDFGGREDEQLRREEARRQELMKKKEEKDDVTEILQALARIQGGGTLKDTALGHGGGKTEKMEKVSKEELDKEKKKRQRLLGIPMGKVKTEFDTASDDSSQESDDGLKGKKNKTRRFRNPMKRMILFSRRSTRRETLTPKEG